MTSLQKAVEHVAIHRYATIDNTGRILTADQEARAEIVKLKQEMTELRAAIERIYERVGLKPIDDGWGHAEDGWPWDVSATDGITTAMPTVCSSTAKGWRCSVYDGNTYCCRDGEISLRDDK